MEIILDRRDIDFSAATVSKLSKNLLTQIEIISRALCETPATLRPAIEQGKIKMGTYQASCGQKMIYIHLNNHDFVIPYMTNH
ncbi:MAG: hypothetical protein AB8B89_06045 [Gammaproteobacteria bacterium]